jgi:hypothetical protein
VVYACNGTVCAPASNQVTVIVSPIPIPPDWVTAPATVSLNVNFAVSWASVIGASSYTLQQTNVDTGKVKTMNPGAATSYTTSIGLPGLYQYAVKACDSAGCSSWRNAGNTTDSENGGNAIPASGSSQ